MRGTITLTVGQTDSVSVSQKDESPETMEVLQEEAAPQVNGEKEEKESADADEVTVTEEDKLAQESSQEANEVGFKKIFRFVGFKFTLKKDKNEKVEPVQLLNVKKEEAAEAGGSEVAEDSKEEVTTEEAQPVEEEKAAEEPEASEPTAEPVIEETPTEKVNGDATEQEAKEEEPTEEASPDKEVELAAESPESAAPAVQETQSPLRRFFTQGIFSNLRKKTSFKKPKEGEVPKEEKVPEEDIKEAEETTESPAVEAVETSKEEVTAEALQEEPAAPEEAEAEPASKAEPIAEEELVAEVQPATKEESIAKVEATIEEEPPTETEPTTEAVAPVAMGQEEVKVEGDVPPAVSKEVTEAQPAEVTADTAAAEDVVSQEEKVERSPEGQVIPEEAPVATAEPELLSSQEKAKVQGSPLKKLFSGSGLKKISSKKHKVKKEAEVKLTESGEQVAEQLQSSTESAEGQKGESSASSPEESGEHPVSEAAPAEVSQENEGEATTSDGEKKKDGILPWASFKKLVTPKKRVKRPSESEDEGAEKPKSATLSSTESAEKPEEPKPSEEDQKVVLEQSTEEPKKKMDTSVSWEALICVGSSKKRARKTSDSDDEAPRIEEEALQSGENGNKPTESPLGSSQEADNEHVASSPEPAGSPSDGEGVSTWESLKRFVTPRRKAKAEDKTDESAGASGAEPLSSDGEIPKEESTFSLKKLIPGRRKKKAEGKQGQVSSDEAGKNVGSAEEDSDTPAVVPLSEYDNVEPEQVEIAQKDEAVTRTVADTTDAEAAEPEPKPQPKVEKPSDVVPSAAADERSPSWISASVVEDIQESATECITKHLQLSDIPEEGDTVATPKSTAEDVSRDDTIAEDIVELTSEAVTAVEQALETSIAEETTEMVSAVSRLTESSGTSGETTPVPGEGEETTTEAVLQEVVETVSVELHEPSQATAICTDLESQEIESVEEKTPMASVESVAEFSEATSMEVVVEDKTEQPEVADIAEDTVPEAVAQEVKLEVQEAVAEPVEEATKAAEVEPANEVQEQQTSESAPDQAVELGEVKDEQGAAEIVDELQGVTPINVAVVNAVQDRAEHIEAIVVTENTPKVESEGPAERTVEEAVCNQTSQITEAPTLEGEKVQELDDVTQSSTDAELAPVGETIEVTTQEVITSMPTPPAAVDIKEAPIPVVEPVTECAVIQETVVITCPLSETIQSEEEAAPSVQLIEDNTVLVEVKDTEKLSEETILETEIEAASTEVTVIEEGLAELKATEEPSAEVAVEAEIEAAPTNVSTIEGKVQVVEEEVSKLAAEPVVEAEIEAASMSMSAVVEEVGEKVEEVVEAVQAEQEEEEAIEEQSTVIVQTVIQSVVENLSKESEPESQEVKKTEAAAPETPEASEAVPIIVAKAEEVPGDTKSPETTGDADTKVEPLAATEEAVVDAIAHLAVAEKSEDVEEKSEAVEVSEGEKEPAVAEKPEKQIQEAVQVLQVLPIKDSQILVNEEVSLETASVVVECGSKQVAEVEVKEEEEEEVKVLEEQLEKATESLEGAAKEAGETKVDGKSEGQKETEEPESQTTLVEEAQSERESETSESKAETEVKESEVKGQEELPEAEIPQDAQPSQDIPAEVVVVTEEVLSEAPVAEVPSETEKIASATPQPETKPEAPCHDEVPDIKAEPDTPAKAPTTDSQTPADTAETKTEESAQKDTTEVVQSEVIMADAPSQAQMVAEEVHIAEAQGLNQIQTETVEKLSLDVEKKVQGGDEAAPAESQEQVAAVPETPVEEAQTVVPPAVKEKEKEKMPAVGKKTSTIVEDVKCTEATVQKQAMEMMEETLKEIEPVSTELTAAS